MSLNKFAAQALVVLILGVLAQAIVPGTAFAEKTENSRKSKAAQCRLSLTPDDAAKRQENLEKWLEHFEARTENLKNPFTGLFYQSESIANVHKNMRSEFPPYAWVFSPKMADVLLSKNALVRAQARAIENFDKVAKNPHASPNALFAARDVARWLLSLQVAPPNTQQDAKKDQSEEQKKDQQKQPQQKQEKKEQKKDKKEEDPKPQWNQNRDKKYKPHNKDLDLNAGGKAVLQLHTNAYRDPNGFPYYRYFIERYFDDITVDGFESNEAIRPKTPSMKGVLNQNPYRTTIKTSAMNNLIIPKTYGFEPIPGTYPKDGFQVVETQPGIFEAMALRGVLPESFDVPMRDTRLERTTGGSIESYKKKSGIQLKQWPDHVQVGISLARPLLNGNPQAAIEALVKYFRDEGPYKYYTRTGNELSAEEIDKADQLFKQYLAQGHAEPVAYAMTKTIQCDTATQIAGLLIRDHLNLPTRMVGGTVASNELMVGQDRELAIMSNRISHAWLEVYINGEWMPFDFTPKANQPQPQGDSEKQKEMPELRPISEQGNEDQKSKPDSQSQPKKDGEKKDGEKKDGEKKDGEKKDGEKKDGEKKEGQGQGQGQSEQQPNQSPRTRELVDGKQSKENTPPNVSIRRMLFEEARNYATARLLTTPRRDAEYSKLTGMGIELKKDVLETTFGEYERTMRIDNAEILRLGTKSIRDFLSEGNAQLMQGRIEDAYYNAYRVQQILQKIASRRLLNQAESTLLEQLKRLINLLKTINHPSAQEHEIVGRLYKGLPGVHSRTLLRERFGNDILTLGSASQKALAKRILAGELAPFMRMMMMRELVELYLIAEKQPRFKELFLMQRRPEPTDKNDLVIAKSPLEFMRMLWNPLPGEHPFAKTFRGEQFALGPQESIRVDDPRRPLERKVSVVMYDISGSMNDQKTTIQDSLLMSIVDWALSDVDDAGRPLHSLVVVPFNDVPLKDKAVFIRTAEDARRFLQDKDSFITKGSGGTDIEATMMYFYDLVEQELAKTQPGQKRITRANLILTSDGGSTVKLENLRARHKQLPKGLITLFNFLAIRESNKELESFAQDATELTGLSYFRHITPEMMDEILRLSAKPEVNKDAFATVEKRPTGAMMSAYETVLKSVGQFGSKVDSVEIKQLVSRVHGKKLDVEKLPHRLRVSEFLQIAKQLTEQSPSVPKELRQKWVYQLLLNYPSIVGRPLSEMTYLESDAFQALVKWAEAGPT